MLRHNLLTFHNFADKLSWLAGFALDAEPGLVPHRLPVSVHPDETDRIHEGEEDGGEAHAARLALQVDHAGVALRGAVELADKLDSKPLKQRDVHTWDIHGPVGSGPLRILGSRD